MVCAFLVLVFNSSAQEPAWGMQAKEDSINARSERSMQKFSDAMDKFLIVDFAREGLKRNTLVKTTPFLQYPAIEIRKGGYYGN